MILRAPRLCGVLLVLCGAAACAGNPPPVVATGPRYPGYPTPDIPLTLRVSADVRDHQTAAWQRLQAGDLRGATRDFTAILKQSPAFYPAETGLGFANLADHQLKQALAHFQASTAKNDRYLPALLGEVDAQLGLNDDAAAIACMERVLVLDPKREAIRSRLELVKFRRIQALIEAGRKARTAGKLDDARRILGQALDLSPSSTAILRELWQAEQAEGLLADAEAHARKATQLEPSDPEHYIALAAILEARQNYRDASAAVAKAVALDPKPEWRDRVKALRDKANLALLPADFGNLSDAAAVNRAEVAAYIGIKLEALIAKAPHRVISVATDVRSHWAAPWILPVTEAGIMDIFANHTFQPSATVRRSDLAQIVAELVTLAARPADLVRWRAARPVFSDLPATHLLYRSAAVSVAAGALSTDKDGRFQPTRAADGGDLTDAVARIEQLAKR